MEGDARSGTFTSPEAASEVPWPESSSLDSYPASHGEYEAKGAERGLSFRVCVCRGGA